MKEILEKVARFVELSKEFTTDENQIYEGYQPNGIVFTTNGVNFNYNIVGNTVPKVIQYEIYLEEKLNMTRRYEEYKNLQASLSEYFASVEKLTFSKDENVEGRV